MGKIMIASVRSNSDKAIEVKCLLNMSLLSPCNAVATHTFKVLVNAHK